VVPDLVDPAALAVSPDGRNVYVVARAKKGLFAFNRDPASGALAALPTPDGCIVSVPLAQRPGCTAATGLLYPTDLAVSPDGTSVYVTSGPGTAEAPELVALFRRDTGSGRLTQLPAAAGCLAAGGGAGRCRDVNGLDEGAKSVAISPDSRDVYVVSSCRGATCADAESDPAIAVLLRDTRTGELRQPSGTRGCVSYRGTKGCAGGVENPASVAVSPDSKRVYVGSVTPQTSFGHVREYVVVHGPSCPDRGPYDVYAGVATPLDVTCTDPDGLPLRYSIAEASRGKVGPFDEEQGTVLYTAPSGFVGRDFFSFRASNGTYASKPAEVLVNVKPYRFVDVITQQARASGLGKVGLVIECPPFGTRCRGTITVVSSQRYVVSGRRLTIRLARGSFTIPADTSRRVHVRLTPLGKRLLLDRRRVRARMTITTRDDLGTLRRKTYPLVLLAPAKR
jgi:DNA-binding beta-propeller fold protein YncE